MSDPNEKRTGYKETKVGWIPEEWTLEKLGSIVTIQSGGTPSMADKDYWGGDIPWFCARDLKSFRLNSSVNMVTAAGAENGTRLIPKGTILVLVRGMMLNRDFPVGVTTRPACFNQDLKALTVDENRCATDFLAYFLAASKQRFLSQVDRSSHGTGKLQTEVLKSAPILVPPLSEQHEIAEILSTCDEAIEKTGALIDAKKRQKKALMQQLLTGKKRLPGFEGKWTEVKIGDLFEQVNRPVEWDDKALYNLISVRRRSGGLFFRDALHGKDILTKVMNTTHTGDFLISKMQVVHGAMAMTPPEFDGGHVSGSYITLVAKDDAPIHMPFFDYLSQTKWLYHLTYISSYGVVIEKMTFNLKDFLKKTVQIPPTVEEQERIAQVLKICEDEDAALNRKRDALKQQKKSLMQKLLSGQVRVQV